MEVCWLPLPWHCAWLHVLLASQLCTHNSFPHTGLLCVLFVCCRAYPFLCVWKEMVYKTNRLCCMWATCIQQSQISWVVAGFTSHSWTVQLLPLWLLSWQLFLSLSLQRMHTRSRQWLMVMLGSWTSWTQLGRYKACIWLVSFRDQSLWLVRGSCSPQWHNLSSLPPSLPPSHPPTHLHPCTYCTHTPTHPPTHTHTHTH